MASFSLPIPKLPSLPGSPSEMPVTYNPEIQLPPLIAANYNSPPKITMPVAYYNSPELWKDIPPAPPIPEIDYRVVTDKVEIPQYQVNLDNFAKTVAESGIRIPLSSYFRSDPCVIRSYQKTIKQFFDSLLTIAGSTADFNLIHQITNDMRKLQLDVSSLPALLDAQPPNSYNATSTFMDALAKLDFTKFTVEDLAVCDAAFAEIGSKNYVELLERLEKIGYPVNYPMISRTSLSSGQTDIMEHLLKVAPEIIRSEYNNWESLAKIPRYNGKFILELLLDSEILSENVVYQYLIYVLGNEWSDFELVKLILTYLSEAALIQLFTQYPNLTISPGKGNENKAVILVEYFVKHIRGRFDLKRVYIGVLLQDEEIFIGEKLTEHQISDITELALRMNDPSYALADPILLISDDPHHLSYIIEWYKENNDIDKTIEMLRTEDIEYLESLSS